jgi:hypothetical protein
LSFYGFFPIIALSKFNEIMKKIFFYTTVFVCLHLVAACKNTTDNDKATINAENLTDYNVYLANLGKYDKSNLIKAEQFVKEAESLQNESDKAIDLYKKALEAYPPAQAYLGLSRNMATKDNLQAIAALKMAEKLLYTPEADLYYEAAKQMVLLDTALKLNECEGLSNCLQKAVQAGFKDYNRFKQDFINPNILRGIDGQMNYAYEVQKYSHENEIISGYLKIVPETEKKKAICQVLSYYFSQGNFPYSIDDKNLKDLYSQSMNSEIPYCLLEYLPFYETQRQVRYDGSASLRPIAQFYNNKGYMFLFFSETYPDITFDLITYNENGEQISLQRIAQFTPNTLQTATIAKGGKIEIKKYNAKIERSYLTEKVSFTVSNKEFVEATFFSIKPTGEIE